MKRRLILLFITILMVMLSVGNLCGQHYMTDEIVVPQEPSYILNYVKGVYILEEVDNG